MTATAYTPRIEATYRVVVWTPAGDTLAYDVPAAYAPDAITHAREWAGDRYGEWDAAAVVIQRA